MALFVLNSPGPVLDFLASKPYNCLIGLYCVLCLPACLQPWYSALEAMRYLLPDDQAREKLAGQSWQVGVRLACTLACFCDCQLALPAFACSCLGWVPVHAGQLFQDRQADVRAELLTGGLLVLMEDR